MNEDDYGRCPNCGEMVCVEEMGVEGGTTCCRHCKDEVRDK